MLQGPTEDLLNTNLTHMKDNFLWVASYLKKGPDRPKMPYFDWFDDERWETVLHNVEAMARLAKTGGLKGIMFDNEEYGVAFWSYNAPKPARELKTKPPYKGKTAAQVGEQVRYRGRQFIKAINKGFPGCAIWTLNGYGKFVHHRSRREAEDLPELTLGMSIVFLDGMLEASDENTIFIDGNEGAYRYGELNQFVALGESTRKKAIHYTRVPDLYRKKVRVGFGIYLDYSAPHNRDYQEWNSDEPDKNQQSPERLEKAIRFAIQAGDGYVWIYSEYPSWWLDHPGDTFGEGVRMREPGTHKWMPSVYRRAVENAISK